MAVDRISFEIQAGECFGFLGPNGAGKTSTIRMIYGFSPITERQSAGFREGHPTAHREIKARIGVCQQENNLDPDLSVWDNLHGLWPLL